LRKAQSTGKDNQASRKARTKSRVGYIDQCSSDSTYTFDTDTSDIGSVSSLSHAYSAKHTLGRNRAKLPALLLVNKIGQFGTIDLKMLHVGKTVG